MSDRTYRIFLGVALIFEAVLHSYWTAYIAVLVIWEIVKTSNDNWDGGWYGIPSTEIRLGMSRVRLIKALGNYAEAIEAFGHEARGTRIKMEQLVRTWRDGGS